MLSRIAATVMLSISVFIVVTLFMGLGVLWWTGDSTRGVLIGVICGTVAAFTVSAVGTAIGRSGRRSRDEHERSGDRHMHPTSWKRLVLRSWRCLLTLGLW
jgi:Na+/proline symporter